MAFTLTRNRAIAGASAVVAATVTAVMLTMSTSVTLPPPSSVVIGPQAPLSSTWFDNVQINRAKALATTCVDTPPTDPAALDAFIMTQYYDLPMTLYIAASRANDSELLTLARKCADSWWKNPAWIDEGRKRLWASEEAATPPPRHAGIGGLVLRALDGRPEMWDWINQYTRWHFNLWLKSRVNDPQLYYGVREGAFMLQYAAWLSQALPDSFPVQGGGTITNGAQLRAAYLTDAETVAVNYFGRLQQSDGSWRWDDPDETEPDGGKLRGVTQPFMVGLLMTALADTYLVTGSSAVKSSITTQITKSCRHLYSDGPYLTQLVPSLNVRIRGFAYYWHGGTTTNPTKYERGNYPANWDTTNTSDVQNARQAIGPTVAAYGFAYQLTKDPYFKAAGDELWDSAYGSTDSIHNYADADGKSYNQNFRSAGRYLVWRGEDVASPTPSTTPTIAPSPTVSTTPAPTPTDGARLPPATQITDNFGIVWTRSTDGRILRNGSASAGGSGSQIVYCNRTVYVFGDNSQWWKWSDAWVLVGGNDPCGVATPSPTASVSPVVSPSPTGQPTPSPAPSPSPSPTATLTATPTPRPSPSPSPVLPACAPNQIIGNPAKCLCTTGVRCTGSNARCL